MLHHNSAAGLQNHRFINSLNMQEDTQYCYHYNCSKYTIIFINNYTCAREWQDKQTNHARVPHYLNTLLTLPTFKGDLKSAPPCRVKPQGRPPSRSMTNSSETLSFPLSTDMTMLLAVSSSLKLPVFHCGLAFEFRRALLIIFSRASLRHAS